MARGYANDSNSHNVSGSLNPTPPPAPSAWVNPPRVTSVINANLPVGFQTRYVSFANYQTTGTPTPWPAREGTLPTPTSYFVPWNPTQSSANFGRILVADSESAHDYFGTQAVIHNGDLVNGVAAWSNLQYEYR